MTADNQVFEAEQNRILRRYAVQIRRAAEHAAAIWPNVEEDDALQEARLLVLSYAGLLSSPGRHFNWLAKHKESAQDLKALLTTTLEMDLDDVFKRHPDFAENREPLDAMREDCIPEDPENPTADPRDETIAKLDFQRIELRLRDDYPFLMMRFDGLEEKDMAKQTGLSRQTIDRRIAEERQRAMHDQELIDYLHPTFKSGQELAA